MFNYDLAYLDSRLNGTYVWIKSEKRLMRYGGALQGRGQRLSDDSKFVMFYGSRDSDAKEIPLREFSFEPPFFRNVNTPGGALCYERQPVRRDWKQGIRTSQYRVFSPGSNGVEIAGRSYASIDYGSIPYINKSINEEFMSFENALEMVEEMGLAFAFSSNFSVTNRMRVLHGNHEVGNVDDNGMVKLNQLSDWCKEELIENIGEAFVVRKDNP